MKITRLKNNCKERFIDRVFFAFLFILMVFGCTINNIQMISILALFTICIFFHKKGSVPLKSIGTKGVGVWYFLFFIYTSLSYYWSNPLAVIIANHVTTIGQLVVFVFCIDMVIESRSDVNRIMKMYCYASTFFALICLITSSPSTYGTLSFGSFTGMQRNTTAYILMYAFFFCMYFWKTTKKKKYMYMCFLNVGISLLTGSRKIIFGYIFALLLWTIFQGSLTKKIKHILMIALTVVLVVPMFYQVPYFRDTFGERLLAVVDSSIEDSSNESREMAKVVATDLFQKHPVLGAGWNSVKYNYGVYYENYFYNEVTLLYAHNNYLELGANFGLIGILLYYLKFLKPAINSFIKPKTNFYEMLLAICVPVSLMIDWGQVAYCYVYTLFIHAFLLKMYQFSDFKRTYSL